MEPIKVTSNFNKPPENKIKKLIGIFKELPKEKKMVIASFFVAGLILFIGTVGIIFSSVLNVDNTDHIASLSDFVSELVNYQEEIDTLRQSENLDKINDSYERIDANFDNYKEDLEDIDYLINTFELPYSAPIE